MNTFRKVTALVLTLFGVNCLANSENPRPSVEQGAKVYTQRCILCHGSQAMGDGVLPLKLGKYPVTNLRQAKRARSIDDIENIIVYGGTLDNISEFMPPFGKELTWTELESVTQFIDLIRSDSKRAVALIDSNMNVNEHSVYQGQDIYATRCVLCHGKYGEGNGRMSKLLKNPPPANLVISRLPDEYLMKIIKHGGEGVGRSKHMPPWKDQLNDQEIKQVIVYLKSIRKP